MNKTILTVVLLFSVQSYASFIDRAAYLLSQTGTLKSKITKTDCSGVERGDWLDCASGDCKALVFDNPSVCETWDCRAITALNASHCTSGDCRGLIQRDPSLCDSKNCKAITSGEPERCADEACKILLKYNALVCR